MYKTIIELENIIKEIGSFELKNYFNNYNIISELYDPTFTILRITKDNIIKYHDKNNGYFEKTFKDFYIFNTTQIKESKYVKYNIGYIKKFFRIIKKELYNYVYVNNYIDYSLNKDEIINILEINENTLTLCNKKTINIRAEGFYGFYESIYNNSDSFYENEYEYKSNFMNIHPLITNDNIEINYIIKNNEFRKYMYDISDVYSNNYIELLENTINNEFSEYDENILIEYDENFVLEHPKYYNYLNDEIYLDIIINNYTLELIKNNVLIKHEKQFMKYLKNNCTSYDGYISFLSNDYYSYLKNIICYSEIEINLIIKCFILFNNNDEIIYELNEKTYYEISIYEYEYNYYINNEKEYFYIYNHYNAYFNKSKYASLYNYLRKSYLFNKDFKINEIINEYNNNYLKGGLYDENII